MTESLAGLIFKVAVKELKAHKIDILFGMGVSSVIASYPATVKATVKAVRKVDSVEKNRGKSLTRKEVIEEVYPYYFDPLIKAGGGLGAMCFVEQKLAAALFTSNEAIKLLNDRNETFKEATEQTLSKQKKKEVDDAIIARDLNSYMDNFQIIPQGKGGHVLTYDELFGLIFYSDQLAIETAELEFNRELINGEMTLPYSYFLNLLDLDAPRASEKIGFDIDRPLNISVGSTKINNIPMLKITHLNAPRIIQSYGGW